MCFKTDKNTKKFSFKKFGKTIVESWRAYNSAQNCENPKNYRSIQRLQYNVLSTDHEKHLKIFRVPPLAAPEKKSKGDCFVF